MLDKFEDHETILFRPKNEWIQQFLYRKAPQSEISTSFIFGYEKDDPSYAYFKTKILDQHSSEASLVPEETLYTSNLQAAKKFFQKKTASLDKPTAEEIYKKLLQRFKFNLYEISDDLDVFVAFETMNNRGKPLSKLELLKNRLIYLSTLIPASNYSEEDKKRLRDDVNNSWKTIYYYLGKNPKNSLSDDEFLNNHWITYFKYSRKEAAVYAKFLLNEHFTVKNLVENRLKLEDIKNYVDSISKSVISWFNIHNPQLSNYDDGVITWLNKLNRLGYGAFRPLVMSAMVKQVNEDKLEELLKAAEEFNFCTFMISRRQANTDNSHIYRLANQFNEDAIEIDDVIKDINEHTDYWFDLERFQDYIEEQFTRDKQGFYGWNGLRYLLYEYEIDCQRRARSDEIKVTWAEFNKRKKEETIEHIYPQKANFRCWKDNFNIYTEEQRGRLLNSLGNLLLLSRAKNSSLQNKCFDDKKRDGDVGYFNGSYSENEVGQSDDWTPDNILERGLKMLDFMGKRWNFEFDSESEKIKLLGLEFLKNGT